MTIVSFTSGRLDLSWLNVKIMEGGVFQSHGAPIGLHKVGVQPLCQFVSVSYGSRQRNQLGIGLDVPQTGEVDLQGSGHELHRS